MLANPDVLSADDHCRIALTRQYERRAACMGALPLQCGRRAADTAAAALGTPHILCTRNGPSSPGFDIELAAAHAPDYMRAAVWSGRHRRDTWRRYARTGCETALSLCVRRAAAPTRAAVQAKVDGSANPTRKNCRSGVSASALARRGPRQPSHWAAWSASRTSST